MPISAEQYVTAQNGAVRLALRALRAAWGKTDGLDALDRRRALEDVWPLLVARYGEITMTLAADRFEDSTGLAAVLADEVDPDRANARLRWGLAPLFGGDGEAAALGRLATIADELVKQPGRDTTVKSAAKHKLRVARIPSGRETCAYCLILASRGFCYGSKATALASAHGGCDCRVAVETEDTEGYDPDELYARYQHALRKSDKTDPLAALREVEGTH